MRRLIYICLFVAIVPWIVIGIVRGATNDDTKDHYFVRAIFDNASTIVPGEDVKIAGVPIGVVSSMDITDDNKAAVTLQINDSKFTPFKTDATCKIRLQGLIGERFVECEPGSADARQLATIEHGDGKGERLLSVDHNSAPVDLDLLNDILRLPYRQRFAILLSELGVGLAGRGEDLNQVIHRANPALKETDDVLAILAKQNHVLARLARDSDQALAPISREREHFADFIEQANKTGEATAERATDQRRTLQLLPDTLRQLRLLMVDLGSLADQGTPLLTDVNASAPDLGRLIKAQGTLAQASNKAFPSLGDALEVGRPALVRSRPLIQDLSRLGTQIGPTAKNLDLLTKSLDETHGIDRINDFLYYVTLSLNGYDSLGHYLRAAVVANNCSGGRQPGGGGCNSNFREPGSSVSSTSTPAAKVPSGGSVPATGTLLQGLLGTNETPQQATERKQAMQRLHKSATEPSKGLGKGEPMLDYLLGGGGQ